MEISPEDGLDPSGVLPSSCHMGAVGKCLLVFKLSKSFDPVDGAGDSVSLTPGGCAVCSQAFLLPTAPLAPLLKPRKRWGYGGGFCRGCLGSAPRVNGPGVLQGKPQRPGVN